MPTTKRSTEERARELLGTDRPKIADLLADAVQMNPPLAEDEFNDLAASIARMKGRLHTMPIVISGLGHLVEGNNRLAIVRDQHGRKSVTLEEFVIDWTIKTPEQEALASISIQNSRRASTGAVKAYQIRRLVDRTGWSYGKVAESLGIPHRSQVSRYLSDYPEPGWNPPAMRLGKDGRETMAEREPVAVVADEDESNVPERKRTPRPKANPHPWDLRAGEAFKLVETLTSRLQGAWAPDRTTLTDDEWDAAKVRLVDLEAVIGEVVTAMGVNHDVEAMGVLHSTPAEPTDEELGDE
jgi:hypothetical protein